MTEYNPALAQIGNRICKRREELGMTSTELTIQADLSSRTLSNVENGSRNISVEKFCAIAKALKVPLSHLQPEELDTFLDVPEDILELNRQMNRVPQSKRRLLIAMFTAQLNVVIGSEEICHP